MGAGREIPSCPKPSSSLCSFIDNVELILKTISNQHSVETHDNDQPDYDSVASDEDTDLDAGKASRQKVRQRAHGMRQGGAGAVVFF